MAGKNILAIYEAMQPNGIDSLRLTQKREMKNEVIDCVVARANPWTEL